MKYIVKTPKTNLVRMSTIERARYELQCVMDSNPLTEKEKEHFNEVLACLNKENKLHARCNFDEEDFFRRMGDYDEV